jgi:oligopeptide transport system ATP-binding protein
MTEEKNTGTMVEERGTSVSKPESKEELKTEMHAASAAATAKDHEAAAAGTHLWKPEGKRLLEVVDLQVEFRMRDGVAKAINGASFTLDQGETLAILGESGSGKSVTAQAVMGILDTPPGYVTGGNAFYCGVDLLKLPEKQRQRIRGAQIAMIFQDALSALNPVFPVGWQIAEMFRIHRKMNKTDAMERAIELMEKVHIPAARQRVKAYPHQFSGGMRQRIMIAMAIALNPAVLIADEPTTALDVTVQAQIMDLLKELQAESGMGLILITHDLGVVADVADKIAVMYAGRMVEQSDIIPLYQNPLHPYTQGLLMSVPRLDQKGETLPAIGGLPPNLLAMPEGCPFWPRCKFAKDICKHGAPPPSEELLPGRFAACWRAAEINKTLSGMPLDQARTVVFEHAVSKDEFLGTPGTPVDDGTPVEDGTGTPVEDGSGTPVEDGSGTPVEEATGTPVEERGTSVSKPASEEGTNL